MKLILKEAPNNSKFLWLCEVGGNIGDAEAVALYGGDRKLMGAFTRDVFDGPMSVKGHPTIVTALRTHSGLVSAGDNWEAIAATLDTIPDANAVAESLGYNLNDWIGE